MVPQALTTKDVGSRLGLSSARAADYERLHAIVDGIVKAINDRNSVAMSRYYSTDSGGLFFGPPLYDRDGRLVGGQDRTSYFRGLATGFAFFKAVDCQRNDDENFRIGDRIAVWTGTGTNYVTFRNDVQTVTPWRWTMVFEKMSDGEWIVIHDHSSFGGSHGSF
jgi:hypothetical protein